MPIIALIVVAIVIWIYWNPSERLKEKWKRRQSKWEKRIGKIQEERGVGEVWRNDKNEIL